MSETTPATSTTGYSPARNAAGAPPPTNLADILERVLDKGIIIAGDIQVNLLDPVELLQVLTHRLFAELVEVDVAHHRLQAVVLHELERPTGQTLLPPKVRGLKTRRDGEHVSAGTFHDRFCARDCCDPELFSSCSIRSRSSRFSVSSSR